MKAFIFDMDGVLVDNADLHLEAFLELGKELDANYSREDVKQVFGQRNDEMLPALLGRNLDQETVERIAERKEALYRDLIRDHLAERAVKGVVDFVQKSKREGRKIGLATSGPAENVELVLQGLNIESAFDVIVTGKDVSQGKPHPEVFLLASSRLGQIPESVVVFEDSPSGVEAARRAGAKCVALATTHEPHELEDFEPVIIVRDFEDLQRNWTCD